MTWETLAKHFGSRSKLDKAIMDYNATAKRQVLTVRGLMAKLMPEPTSPKHGFDAVELAHKVGDKLTADQRRELAAALLAL